MIFSIFKSVLHEIYVILDILQKKIKVFFDHMFWHLTRNQIWCHWQWPHGVETHLAKNILDKADMCKSSWYLLIKKLLHSMKGIKIINKY
jgi:hypothetical protein